jgi:adenylate cyclase
VNIAARIEPVAESGGICLSSAVYKQVRNKIPNELEKLRPTAVKGMQASIDLYRVVLPWSVQTTSPSGSAPTGIAILPFTNISPDPKDEYIADGLTEELITVLSQLRELQVIARTSVNQYKATIQPVSQIGAELGVSSILEGSVRQAGNRLRITAQLIDAKSQRHVWAETYDRDLDDGFAVQAEIARQVAEALKVELQPAERARLDNAPSVRADSYLAYLKGRTLMHLENAASWKAAKEQFDLAISLDPQNASAYSGLSDFVGLYGSSQLGRSTKELKETGRRLAERAIELDPNLAEAHASSAATLWLDWDWVGAEREFQRALSLNPSYSQAHHWYAELLSWQVRIEESLLEWALAEASDPLAPWTLSHHAALLTWLGKYQEALVARPERPSMFADPVLRTPELLP